MFRLTPITGTTAVAAFGLIALVLAADAVAQIAPAPVTENADALNEVIVTAERRSESIQSTPVSVTAISGDLLTKFDNVQFDDYAHDIPNLSFGTGNGYGVADARAITIRGIAGTNTTSYYIDDTPLPLSLDPAAIDLERIEVLRGPQGTLFGSSAMGGTVRLITRQPDLDAYSGFLDLQGLDVHLGGPGYSASGTLNAPLIQDNLALKISAYSSYQPGIFTRQYGVVTTPGIALPPGASTGQVTHIGNDRESGAAISLTFRPSDLENLSITPMLIHQEMTSNGFPLADFTPSDLIQVRPLNVAEGVSDAWTFTGLTAKYGSGLGDFISSSTYFHRQTYDNEDGTEAVATGLYGTPPLGPVYSPSSTPTWNKTNALTQELRFESAFRGPVQLVAGAFYNDTRIGRSQAITIPVDSAGDSPYIENSPATQEQRAGFASVTYAVTHALELSAGVRETHFKSTNIYSAYGWANGGVSYVPTSHEENSLTPRFTAKYRFDESNMVYASGAKGFRIGGENAVLPPVCYPDEIAAGLSTGPTSYKSDSLWSYELGTKNSWADGRFRTRLAVYYIDWAGLQQRVLLPCTFAVTENVGSAVSKGAEFEADLAPLHGLTMHLGLGYEDAAITSTAPGAPTVDGQPLNGVPRWTGSFMSEYAVPMSFGSGFVRGQYSYTGSSLSYNNDPVGLYRASYSLVNLFFGAKFGSWESSVFVKNLLDVRGNLGDEQSESAQLPGRPRWAVTLPRIIGIDFRWHF